MTVDCYILWNVSDPQQFYRALGTTAKAEERLNAITYNALKKSLSGDEKTVILDADSELAKILMGAY